jgi:hypothetical protein
MLNLKDLIDAHREEISGMERGIRGDLAGNLWTAALRASIRGGKPCGFSQVDEAEHTQ